MPRPKTQSDEQVLDAALAVMHDRGPEALTFSGLAQASGLSAATLVQRFRDKAGLRQSALQHAWNRLDERTTQLSAIAPRTPSGAIALLVDLSQQYGGIESYAEGLLMLREDLRNPVLRSRGAAWKEALSRVLEDCFSQVPDAPKGIGLLLATQWQGSLLWWSFDPKQRVEDYIEASLKRFVAAILPAQPPKRRR
jgi:AcrR family transcriptional regulator